LPIAIDQDQSLYLVRLEGAITISCAAELKQCLLEGLASRKDLQVDLEQASALDITAMQLLWAARRQSERTGKSLTTAGALPGHISAAIREAGMEGLGFPSLQK